jgi:hypothetical protein
MKIRQFLNNALLTAGGSNLYGQPNFRLVWSESRFEIAYGKQVKKYGVGRDRWILEKWCPPEMYGNPATWEFDTKDPESGELILGPFPHQGEYEHSYTFDQNGVYIEPTEELVLLICRCIERGKMHTRSERWAAIMAAQEQVAKDRKRMFDDMWDDAKPAPGAKIPEHIQMLDSITEKNSAIQAMPRALPRRGLKMLNEEDVCQFQQPKP